MHLKLVTRWIAYMYNVALNIKGLFTRKEGYYPSKQVKVSSGLQANFKGRVTLSPGSTLQNC